VGNSEKKYLEAVMDDFFTKCETEDLYPYLNNPRPDNIKNLALNHLLYERRLNKDTKDVSIINSFLNFGSEEISYVPRKFDTLVQDIRSYKKYRRISQFIYRYQKNASSTTSTINVDFIAWLIDFVPRPELNYKKGVQGISRKKVRTPKSISKLEIKKEELEELFADFNILDFKKILGEAAQNQLSLMLEEWKENQLMLLFEDLIEKRLMKLEKKLSRSKRVYKRFGFLGLIFLGLIRDDEVHFEEDLFSALGDYQIRLDNSINVISYEVLHGFS